MPDPSLPADPHPGDEASRPLRPGCSQCGLRELCLPQGLSSQELNRLDRVVTAHRKVRRGAPLFRGGDPFVSLFAIRTGFFKTCTTSEDGRGQVTGFQMAGEIIGLDGIASSRHTCDAIALEDSEVCVMPFDRVGELSREVGQLQHHLHLSLIHI